MTHTTHNTITGGNTMNINDFIAQVAQELNAEPTTQEKANGVFLHGVTIPTTDNMKAVIYLDEYFKDGTDIKDVVTSIKKVIEREKNTRINVNFMNDFEQVKPMLRARLYNEKTNAEISRSAKKYGFNDLIIVPYIDGIEINGSVGAIKVKLEHLQAWNVCAKDVLDIAEQNSKNDAKLQTMAEILQAMGVPSLPDMDTPVMLVATNERSTFGAYSIIPFLDELKAKYRAFTVLPSSVHEVIIVNEIRDEMNAMVSEVNAECVNYEEQLSSHAYTFVA